MVFLNFLPMSSSDGGYPQARGVDLYDNSPLDGSFSFFSGDLVVSTTCSASPLDCGKQGLLVVCLKPHSFAKRLNSAMHTVGNCHFLLLKGFHVLEKLL